MIEFKPIEYKNLGYQNTLNTINHTVDSLVKQHNQGLEAKTELLSAVANLPLNEEEAGYKEQLYNNLSLSIDNFSDNGNLSAAYTKIKDMTLNLLNDRNLQGRVQANKDYTTFMNKVDSDVKLTDMEREFYRDMNPYRYVDTYGDESAFKWRPDADIVHITGAEDLIKRAKQIVSTRIYGDNHEIRLPWNDVAVNKNEDYNYYKAITAEDYKVAMLDLIYSEPDIKESFKRQYEVGMWHDMKHADDEMEMIMNRQVGINPTTGLQFSFTEWLDKILNSYATIAQELTPYSPYQIMAENKVNNNLYNFTGTNIANIPKGNKGGKSSSSNDNGNKVANTKANSDGTVTITYKNGTTSTINPNNQQGGTNNSRTNSSKENGSRGRERGRIKKPW